jgi:sporulation protein YlmC with PRC-barrel domain
MRHLLAGAALFALIAPTAATAQVAAQTGADVRVGGEVVDLRTWNYDRLYADGWRAEELIDADVYGLQGEEIGEVENIIVGTDNRIRSIVVESGGFLDIGDTHLAVPWDQVEIGPGLERVVIPITEENWEDYDLLGEYGYDVDVPAGEPAMRVVDEDLDTGPRAWTIYELLGDYVRLENGAPYGYIRDLVFDEQGALQAVVVSTTGAYARGRYAYPYYGYGYGFAPGRPYYQMPYGDEDVAGAEPFEYGEFGTAYD